MTTPQSPPVATYLERVRALVEAGDTVAIEPYATGHRITVTRADLDVARIVITGDARLVGAYDPEHLLDRIGYE